MAGIDNLSERSLFDLYRNYLRLGNKDGAREVVMEMGRRGLDKINGERIEELFARNPVIKEWYDKGKETSA